MKNEKIIESISTKLLKNKFIVKTVSGCFDIVARNGNKILLVKCAHDANYLSQELIEELKNIAYCIKATPIIVAEKAGNYLENQVVYSRFKVYTVNEETFQNAIMNNLPLLKATKAGITAGISQEDLKQKREENEISINELSKKIGVSTKMILNYESGNSEISFQKAIKLYDLFGEEVFNKINLFSELEDYELENSSQIGKKYSDLGFNTVELRNVTDLIAKKENNLIFTSVEKKFNKKISELSNLLEANNLIIFNKKKSKIDIPQIKKQEFLCIENGKELIKIVKEF